MLEPIRRLGLSSSAVSVSPILCALSRQGVRNGGGELTVSPFLGVERPVFCRARIDVNADQTMSCRRPARLVQQLGIVIAWGVSAKSPMLAASHALKS